MLIAVNRCLKGCCFFIGCGIILAIHTTYVNAEQNRGNTVQTHREAGLSIDFSVEPKSKNNILQSGDDASAIFWIKDAKKQEPVSGLNPIAWMLRRHAGDVGLDSQQCEKKIQELHQGHLSHQADVNLSSFLILTLNQDNSISVVNPQIAWSRTKLEAMVELPGRGDAWVLDMTKENLYVVAPEQSAVVFIDTKTWQKTSTLYLGQKASSAQVFLQSDDRILWIALDKANEIFAIDIATNQVLARIPVGYGDHHLASSTDGQWVYVTDKQSNSLAIIDTKTLKKRASIILENQPSAVAVNPATDKVYIGLEDAGVIQVIDPQVSKITYNIAVDKGINTIRFNHDGSFGFALNREQSTVSLLDVKQQKITATSRVVEKPDQVVFSHHYAYVRGLTLPQFSVFDLTQVAKGELAPANVEAGQQPASKDPASIANMDMIVPAPDGHGAILANAPDKKLYYYMEGMMAASGSLDNGGYSARGLMVLDRSLKEAVLGGEYSVAFNLPAPGEYDVPFVLDKPRIRHCFHVKVEAAQNQADIAKLKPAISVESTLLKTSKDKPVAIRYKITDYASQKPLENIQDAEILVIAGSGNGQAKHRIIHEGVGIYSYKLVLKKPSNYVVMLRIPSLALDYNRDNQIRIEVNP
jgi:YVTN family beta-propeller protein